MTLNIYSRYDVMYTVVPVADVDRRLICLLNPRVLHGPPRYIYVKCGKYSLLTSHHVLKRILELYHVKEDFHNNVNRLQVIEAQTTPGFLALQ